MRQRSTISPSGAYISIFVWLAYFRCFRSTNGFQNNYNGGTHTVAKTLFLQRSLVALSVIASDMDDDYTFPDNVIDALDLVPLLQGVGRHTGTRRGHQALLSLVKEDQVTVTRKLLGQTKAPSSSRRWRAEGTIRYQKQQPKSKRPPLVPIAKSSEEARQEYQLVEAATLALSENVWNLTYPPFYGTESNPGDTSTIEETDNDEWLMLPADAWSLEHILQAEQVIDTLLQTQRWANREEMQTWMPELSKIGAMIDPESILPSILEEIAGRVEIVRVRTLLDSSAKAVSLLITSPKTTRPIISFSPHFPPLLSTRATIFDSDQIHIQF